MTNYNILIRLLEAAYLVYVRVTFFGFSSVHIRQLLGHRLLIDNILANHLFCDMSKYLRLHELWMYHDVI